MDQEKENTQMKTGTFSKGAAGEKVALVRMVKAGDQAANLLDRIVSEALNLLNGRKLTAAEAAAQALADRRLAGLAEAYRQSGGKLSEASLARLLADRLGSGTKPGPHVDQVTEPPPTTVRSNARTAKGGATIAAQLDALAELYKIATELAQPAGWRAVYGPYQKAEDRVRAGVSLAVAVAELKATIRT